MENKEEQLNEMSMMQLLELKEEYRLKHGLYFDNEMGERGTRNHKTEQYFCCNFSKRVRHPTKKGLRWNARCSYGTFPTYREALIFCLSVADRVLQRWNEDYGNR